MDKRVGTVTLTCTFVTLTSGVPFEVNMGQAHLIAPCSGPYS